MYTLVFVSLLKFNMFQKHSKRKMKLHTKQLSQYQQKIQAEAGKYMYHRRGDNSH